MTEHTPTPWQISDARTVDDTAMIVGGEGFEFGLIADVTEDYDAAFIVKAVNAHDALVEALKLARARIEYTQSAAKFVMWALLEGSWQGLDINGGEAQDKAVELGLIVPTLYDPKKHGESANCRPGDHWFVPSEALLSALSQASRA